MAWFGPARAWAMKTRFDCRHQNAADHQPPHDAEAGQNQAAEKAAGDNGVEAEDLGDGGDFGLGEADFEEKRHLHNRQHRVAEFVKHDEKQHRPASLRGS